MGKNRNVAIKAIWSISKKELGMTREDLYELLYRETHKGSMSDCTDVELNKLLNTLVHFKEQGKLQTNRLSDAQYKYIKAMEKDLGWDKEPERLQGFIEKSTKVANVQWLTPGQASNVIEGLKNMMKAKKQREEAMLNG